MTQDRVYPVDLCVDPRGIDADRLIRQEGIGAGSPGRGAFADEREV